MRELTIIRLFIERHLVEIRARIELLELKKEIGGKGDFNSMLYLERGAERVLEELLREIRIVEEANER